MKIFKKVLVFLLVILIVIQFIRPTKNVSTAQSKNNIAQVYAVPANVNTIMEKACYDCHSNNTRYPWYSRLQPVAWWLNDHIKEGKRELNFDDFKSYSPRKQYNKLNEVIEQVKEGEMPLTSYTIVHTNAKLSDEEKNSLMNWADDIRKSMETKYPMDSLLRKKRETPKGA
ncbi:MAG TPA: heme-binding domain-containing protein [Segetibacter sp.]|jgi:hypothetical protein